MTAEKGIPRIKEYDGAGAFRSMIAPPSCFEPEQTGLDVAVGADGRVFVLDPKLRKVRIFSASDPGAAAK